MNERERATAQRGLARARQDIALASAALGRHNRRADDLRSSTRSDAAPRLAKKLDELQRLNRRLAVCREREAKYTQLLAS